MSLLPYICSPLSEDDIDRINGSSKGIQGNRNSCYLDATLFSMFSFTQVFDSFLISDFESMPSMSMSPVNVNQQSHKTPSQDEVNLALKVQGILRDEIVNTLRKELNCPASNVMRLREAMQHLDDKMTSEEMDPQEFLHLLFNKVFHLEEFLSLSSGESDFFHQLLIHYNEGDKNKIPSVQQLLEQSLMLQDLKFKGIPSPALILQMPRSGNQYKTFEGIVPNLTIDITDLIENTPRQCIICGKLATWECSKCYNLFSQGNCSNIDYDGKIGCGAESTAFCEGCLEKSHLKRERNFHRSLFEKIKYNFSTSLYFPQDLDLSPSKATRNNTLFNNTLHVNGNGQHSLPVSNINNDYIPRVKMDLFAVICIETSHFVSFVKCGSSRKSPWVFFDSMSDRVENPNGTGHNIPHVKMLPKMGLWLDEMESDLKIKDSRYMEQLNNPELKRLLSDPYICLYTAPKTSISSSFEKPETANCEIVDEMKNKPPNKKAKLEVFQPVESPVSKAASSSASASTSASSSIAHSPSTQQGLIQSTSTSYPALNVLDLSTLPQITHLISQKASEIQIPSMEDVDQLQTELETMWSSLSFRLRLLQREQANLQNNSSGQNNHQSSSRHTDSIHFNAISKVLGEDFDLNHSQEKINAVATIIDSGHGTRTSVSAAAKLVMSTSIQPASPASSSSSSTRKSGNVKSFDNKIDKQSKKKVKFEPQNKRGAKEKEKFAEKDGSNCQPLEAPNIFWDFANTYCKEITKEDLTALDKMIEDEKNVPDSLFQIPPLGKPQRESSTATTSTAGNNNSTNLPTKDVCGPWTQKLVTSLVDVRMTTFTNQQLNLTNGTTKDDSEGFFLSRPDLVKAIGLDTSSANTPGAIQMETRLRQVLTDQDLCTSKLDDDDELSPTSISSDEVLNEIKKTQNTLKKLQQHNYSKLMELHNCGKREIERASIRGDLDKCDREIQEGYKNSILGKIKKKPLTTKEKEVIFKALAERNALIKSLK